MVLHGSVRFYPGFVRAQSLRCCLEFFGEIPGFRVFRAFRAFRVFRGF